MSDEQTMPDVIYARPAGNGCGWWYPQDDDDTPYLRCPDNIDPADAVVVKRVAVEKMRVGILEKGTTIATLTAERDALRGDVQAAIDTIKQNQANPTDKYVDQRTMYLLDRLTTALAQLKQSQSDSPPQG